MTKDEAAKHAAAIKAMMSEDLFEYPRSAIDARNAETLALKQKLGESEALVAELKAAGARWHEKESRLLDTRDEALALAARYRLVLETIAERWPNKAELQCAVAAGLRASPTAAYEEMKALRELENATRVAVERGHLFTKSAVTSPGHRMLDALAALDAAREAPKGKP